MPRPGRGDGRSAGDDVVLEGVGPVLFEKSRRARRVSVTVRASRGVRVAVPARVSFERPGGSRGQARVDPADARPDRARPGPLPGSGRAAGRLDRRARPGPARSGGWPTWPRSMGSPTAA